jgi:hypothetical protein
MYKWHPFLVSVTKVDIHYDKFYLAECQAVCVTKLYERVMYATYNLILKLYEFHFVSRNVVCCDRLLFMFSECW